jgi:phenylpropionate dioxygenase-like ring-hydroxylating dioxygenase large terminal subunit
MVYAATRGDVPVRVGPGIAVTPEYGPSLMSRDAYTNPARFELERQKVLNAHWLIAGRSVDVAAPGDWLTYEGHGETVVVTRQSDGSLSAFHNVCQHRGPALVGPQKGCGARRFTCPYHGWVYDTTGKLVGVPERDDFSEEHLRDVRAPAVAADEWGGWVWINLSGPASAEPLADGIGADIMTDLGRFKMEDMVVHEVVEWDVPVSYKAIVDGFNELYHVTELHHTSPEFTKATRESPFVVSGKNFMCFVPRPEFKEQLAETLDHHRFTICHYVVFPNTVFNCNPEHIQVFNPIPIDVDRTRFLCWQLIYPGDRNDPDYEVYYQKMERHWEVLKGVVGEDISIYDQLQRTKRSSAYTTHILSARECKIGMYHDTMDRLVAD